MNKVVRLRMILNIRIFDIFGKNMMTTKIETGELLKTIDISDFSGGVYIVCVHIGNHSFKYKITKN